MIEQIYENDNRDTAIRKFDSSMDALLDSAQKFVEEIDRIKNSDEVKYKICTRTLEFAFDIQSVSEILESYVPYIKMSILDIRYEKHIQLKARSESVFLKLKHQAKRVLDNAPDPKPEECEEEAGSDIEPVKGRNKKWMSNSLRTELEKGFFTAFEQIFYNVEYIEDTLEELIFLNQKRSPNDYQKIYRAEKETYFESEKWKNIKDNYIQFLATRRFSDKKPTVEQLNGVYANLYETFTQKDALGAYWESYLDNESELAKMIIAKGLTNYDDIHNMFNFIGKIDIIDEWRKEVKYEDVPFDEVDLVDDEHYARKEVVFVGNWNKEKLIGKWPDISCYMESKKDADYAWCCLHHTMSFYNMIEPMTFTNFMLWLNNAVGTNLISDVYMRKVSTDYFVKTVQEKWYLDKLLEEKDSPQRRNKYKLYCEICQGLKEILIA